MSFPKTTETAKLTFIATVFNNLKSRGLDKKHTHLDSIKDLDKRYLLAQRYDREMRKEVTNRTPSRPPRTDFDIATSSTEDITEETVEPIEETEFEKTSMTAEEVQEHLQNHASRSPYKRKQQNTIKQKKSERKKMLMEKYYEILDWLECIDNGIIKGNVVEAKKIINTLDDYADRLHKLMDSVYYERAKKVYMQLFEIENVLGKQDMEKIRKEVEAYVPINA